MRRRSWRVTCRFLKDTLSENVLDNCPKSAAKPDKEGEVVAGEAAVQKKIPLAKEREKKKLEREEAKRHQPIEIEQLKAKKTQESIAAGEDPKKIAEEEAAALLNGEASAVLKRYNALKLKAGLSIDGAKSGLQGWQFLKDSSTTQPGVSCSSRCVCASKT